MDSNYEIILDLDKMMQRKMNIPNIGDIIEVAIKNGIEELAERLVDKVRENLSAYGLGDSKLITNIDVEILDSGISISIGSDYAIFVEYGTGIVGSQNPHPKLDTIGWIYDVNQHGEKGWYYPTIESDPNPYKIMINGQLYAWTKGMPSRPFMYETWLWGTRSANNIINKHINKELRKLESDLK